MIELTNGALDPEKVTAKVRRDTNGAVVTFLGTTRDNFEGKRVLTLEYEAFEEMAVKKMEEVRKELMAEFGLERSPSATASGRLVSVRSASSSPSVRPTAKRHFTPVTRRWTASKKSSPSGRKRSTRMARAGWRAKTTSSQRPTKRLAAKLRLEATPIRIS